MIYSSTSFSLIPRSPALLSPMTFVPAFVPPVDALNRGGDGLWGNLGDWSRASGYAEAAEALALRLGHAAALGPGQRVVDVGSGAGDQLRLWVRRFGVAHVTGVEKDVSLAGRARERLAGWGLADRVRVVAGEASVSPWTEGPVDAVVALDAAYFFASRSAFLGRCRSALRTEGVLALTDLLLGDGPAARLARGVSPLFSVPRGGLLPEGRYRALLAKNGFEEVRIEDRTDDVLGGFARWTRGGGRDLALAATGRVAGLLARSESLRYVVVTARRGAG
jgi:SAM-dependent methyltransferase